MYLEHQILPSPPIYGQRNAFTAKMIWETIFWWLELIWRLYSISTYVLHPPPHLLSPVSQVNLIDCLARFRSMVCCNRRIWFIPPQDWLQTLPSRVSHHRTIRFTESHWKRKLRQSDAGSEERYATSLRVEDDQKSQYCIQTGGDHTYLGRKDGFGFGEQSVHCTSQVLFSDPR